MSYATVNSCTIVGIESIPVIVEVHLSGGLPGMSIVGLPQTAVRESKDRVKAAIQNAGFQFPKIKITVNLAPADLPKQGGRFDLPIALGVLLATKQIPEHSLDGIVAIGELGLTGALRSVAGVLPSAVALSHSEHCLLIPQVNANEAKRSMASRLLWASDLRSLSKRLSAKPVELGSSAVHMLKEGAMDMPLHHPVVLDRVQREHPAPDMADVKGQFHARRAMEIAAAGAHNMLMSGPPGTGKSMLATRLPSIQTPMTLKEAIESASITSISYAGFNEENWGVRPFRAPHHTSTATALVGGGCRLK